MSRRRIFDEATAYAAIGLPVFPLGPGEKRPLTENGFYDATVDPATIAAWADKWPTANIGSPVPGFTIIDVDRHDGGHDGYDTLQKLQDEHGELPRTLFCCTGGGGLHYYFRTPSGSKLSGSKLGDGVDVKHGGSGYVVLPPSVLRKPGKDYWWVDATVEPAELPTWVVELLRPPTPVLHAPKPVSRTYSGESIADAFAANTSWEEILEPHGWVRCGTSRGATEWRRPGKADAGVSATTHDDTECLFVFSTSTSFEVTEPGRPRGYTKFRAYAVLNHHGDMSAAARALRESR